jgi:hypothetical protein
MDVGEDVDLCIISPCDDADGETTAAWLSWPRSVLEGSADSSLDGSVANSSTLTESANLCKTYKSSWTKGCQVRLRAV